MTYYITSDSITFNENNEVVIMADGEPTFELYRAYLIANGTVYSREFFTQEEIDNRQL
tara:strand:+ start:3255 stop:3428 length:174 start_codon:yes stop_codon:yes gene_type:complete